MNILPSTLSRRRLLGGLTVVGAGAALPAWAYASRGAGGFMRGPGEPARGPGGTDVDAKIMTFAMNLEYLEAEYYTRGATGQTLRESGTDTGRRPGTVRGGHKVNFSTPGFQDHAEELAFNEAAHVRFYREQLGAAAPDLPDIDFEGGFTAAARAAGLVGSSENFNPFADEVAFFLGGMLFEDVGVTAYHGAAPLITSRAVLDAAAGILAVEAYHMGMARFMIWHAGPKYREMANKVCNTRDVLDGPDDVDQPLDVGGKANIVPNDQRGIAFKRTPRQVLSIVCLKHGATKGGFYPSGMNGDVEALLAI